MRITAVDQVPDLFLVQDLLPNSLLYDIKQLDLWSCSWEEQPMQLDWKRRKLIADNQNLLIEVDQHYNNALDQIANATNVVFDHKLCWSSFWLDYEGFDCSIHEDGAERNYHPLMAMQFYLTESQDKLGTVFYHDAAGQHVRYAFPYKSNTGYLMLNHPGQYHGMLHKVPPGHLRLSSYTYFGKFCHK
jgi:hypothetical protein